MSIIRGTKPFPNSLCKRSASACLRTEPNTRNPFEISTFVVPQPIPVETPVTTTSLLLLFAIALLLRWTLPIFNMYSVHLGPWDVKVYSVLYAVSVENRPSNHPFCCGEGTRSRGHPRLIATEHRCFPRPRTQRDLPLLFRSPGTRSCPGKRSCPATGTGVEEGCRRARTGYRNPRDVICLH